MKYRAFGRTGWNVSEVSFGAWAIGGSWGKVDDANSLKAMHAAIDAGVNLIDTADVYGDGRSERLIAQLKSERPGETIHVLTKAGRRLNPHNAEGYNRENLTAFVERSLTNLKTDRLDLVQLHCPPTDVYFNPEVFGVLDDLATAGKIQFYGASVARVEESLKAIEYPNLQSLQIIFNCFRLRPTELLFEQTKKKKVGILARVPLASGVLTGKMSRDTKFSSDDHRQFNRNGEAFDVGETFSGVDFETALQAVEDFRPLVPKGATMAQFALKWILMHDAVSCVIPGAKDAHQAQQNAASSDGASLNEGAMQRVREIYARLIKPQVHQRW